MNLNTNALCYILEVAKAGAISKAAENLFISQPYLSNTINSFEKNLGFKIFVRGARGVKLTDEGAEFVRQAQDVVSRLNALEGKYFYNEDKSTQLRISTTRSYQIISKLAEYINKNWKKENLVVKIKETSPFEVIEDVFERTADFGILHYYDVQRTHFIEMFKRYGLQYEEEYKEKFLLCMSKNNPIAAANVVKKEMLEDQMVVLYGDYASPAISYDYVSETSEAFFSRKRIYVYDRASAMNILNQCPNSYMWYTGLHQDTLKNNDLVLKECEDVEVYDIGSVVYYSKEALSRDAKDAFRMLEKIDWSYNNKVDG